MDLKFRLETPAEHHAVEELTREAFWSFWEPNKKICDEHFLVHKLRNCPSLVPELNIIAEIDGKLVGHIIYTTSKVIDESNNSYEMLTFGPLTVKPQYQGKEIGQALMKHSFEQASKLGYRAVLIFGHPNYYPRVGFRRAAEFGITPADGNNFDAFMAYPLYKGALDGIRGKYYIDPIYESLTEQDTLEFDKQFPYKEPFFTDPISILLDRLEPNARKAIKETGCESLQMMTSKSEREIAALPSINSNSLKIIRSTLREHGIPWGEIKTQTE